MKEIISFVMCILLIAACVNQAAFKDGFDAQKTWVELQVQLPPYPKTENLISFDASPRSSNQYYIDPASIKVGQDGVIRFSLVVKSSTGAMNISYEGIRCNTNERKLYALGRDDKTWSQPRLSDWQRLEYVIQFYAQRKLAKNYFCPHKEIVNSAEEALRALKAGKHPSITY